MRIPSSSTRIAGDGGGKKAETACCTKVGLKRGPWTAEEDELLSNYIKREGEGRWRVLPKKAGLLRCGKSCRLRWMNYLRPSIKRGHISADEEDLILRLHRLLGNRWSLIAGRIPGRTDNEIKNYWNTHLSKKLISQGIDPKTHKPFNPNPTSIHHSCSPPPPPNNATIHCREDDVVKRDEGLRNCDDDDDDDHDGRIINGGDEDDGIVDDSLSSFLNSLINDDMFSTQHQDHQEY